jgi:hypothetical protein
METEMNANTLPNFTKDAALLFILAKIDQYKGEMEFFENKYKRSFHEVEEETHSVKGKEDFQAEEELEDWEFAIKSLEYWQETYSKIRTNAETV